MTPSGTPSTARMTDWLARIQRGVIDMRLPGDPDHIPRATINARIIEYYDQVRARHTVKPAAPKVETPPVDDAGQSSLF